MCHFTDTTGKLTNFNENFNSRQQLHVDDDRKLAGILNFETEKVKNYDIFVFELCDGNISKTSGGSTLSGSISICDQLLEGLIELEKSNSSHNDLKPENVLYNCDRNGDLEIRISDFGQAGRTGGTPGWTWPKFLSERKPGKGDTYSIALLMLYTMCDDREVFYRIRNNYVDTIRAPHWLANFRNDPFFKLIIDMMNLKLTPEEAKCRWEQISGKVNIITRNYLWQQFGLDNWCLRVQDGMDSKQQNIASVSVLDRLGQSIILYINEVHFRVQGKVTLSKTVTKTTIENQGETELCWLYSLVNAVVSSLLVRLRMLSYHTSNFMFLGGVKNAGIQEAAKKLLDRKDLRQKIRRELLFGLLPKTLKGQCTGTCFFFNLIFQLDKNSDTLFTMHSILS